MDNIPHYEKILEILNNRLKVHSKTITIMWIPSHQGILGNTIADHNILLFALVQLRSFNSR